MADTATDSAPVTHGGPYRIFTPGTRAPGALMSDDTSDDKPRRRKRRAVATIDKQGPEDTRPSSDVRVSELEAEVKRLERELRDARRAVKALRR